MVTFRHVLTGSGGDLNRLRWQHIRANHRINGRRAWAIQPHLAPKLTIGCRYASYMTTLPISKIWGSAPADAADFNDTIVDDLSDTGWGAESYSPPGTDRPEREGFNTQFRRLTRLGVELRQSGAGLEWDARVVYHRERDMPLPEHPLCRAADEQQPDAKHQHGELACLARRKVHASEHHPTQSYCERNGGIHTWLWYKWHTH